MKRQTNKKKIIITAAVLAVFLLVIAPFCASAIIYESVFDRYETEEPYIRDISEFEGLAVEEVVFSSFQGNALAGYIYTNDNVSEYIGVIIMAHGMGGGGQNQYMSAADYFAESGFIVFAYDGTGNDAAEGKSARGLPQGNQDLDKAIDYVEADDVMGVYSLCLWGHSQGGYAACAVLSFHPEVKAVVSCAGFNSSGEMMALKGNLAAGVFADIFFPYVTLYERLKFGEYSSATALDGFLASDANVFIIQGEDDESVPPEIGYNIYYEKYADDERFTFCLLENTGHDVYHSQRAIQYMEQFKAEYDAYFETHELTDSARQEYLSENFDKTRAFELNEELFDEMVEFYKESI